MEEIPHNVQRCIQKNDERNSRLHCSVEIKNGKVLLMDLGSTYGTFLSDGTKLEPNKPYYLNYGQSFYLVEPANTFRIV